MKKLLGEPLLHFLVAGGLLFTAYAWINKGEARPDSVQITTAEVSWLKETFARQWQRPPTDAELQDLLVDYVREDLLAREAKALGLDQNDTVIRRRLAQKMRFIVEDTAALAEPPDAELMRLYEKNRAQYMSQGKVSFTQRLFRTEADARAGLARLAARPDAEVGEPTMLESDYAGVDAAAVTSILGPEFSARVFSLPTGQWQGPLESGYGVHLVRIDVREDAQPLPFASVRGQLREEWQRREQERANELYMAGLLKKYEVVADDSIRPLLAGLKGVKRP